MREFVPMGDELFDDPRGFSGPLVPYRCGLPCRHQLRTEPAIARAEQDAAPVATTGDLVQRVTVS